MLVVVEGVVVVQRDREVIEGGGGGGGERWRQRRRGKGGEREAEAKHRSNVDVGQAWKKETVRCVGVCARARCFVFPPMQKRPIVSYRTEQRVNVGFVHRHWYGTA